MSRYLVFAFDHYYPCGGWNDFVGSYDTLDDATRAARAEVPKSDFAHVVDTTTKTVVSSVWHNPDGAVIVKAVDQAPTTGE